MEKTIDIEEIVGTDENGEDVIEIVTRKMKASALLPRMYRFKFGHDLVQDLNKLANSYNKALKGLKPGATEEERNEAQFSVTDLTVFENVAWLMMKHAGEDVGENPDEWLERVPRMFSVYEVMPTVLELWSANQKTTSTP